ADALGRHERKRGNSGDQKARRAERRRHLVRRQHAALLAAGEIGEAPQRRGNRSGRQDAGLAVRLGLACGHRLIVDRRRRIERQDGKLAQARRRECGCEALGRIARVRHPSGDHGHCEGDDEHEAGTAQDAPPPDSSTDARRYRHDCPCQTCSFQPPPCTPVRCWRIAAKLGKSQAGEWRRQQCCRNSTIPSSPSPGSTNGGRDGRDQTRALTAGLSMSSPLADRIALVTGASRGIGRAVALELARAGAHVIALARTSGALEELDDEIRALGGSATLVPVDLKDYEALDRLGAAIHERWGKLDVLVAKAGLLGALSPLGHIEPKVWDDVMAVNVTANWRLIRSLDPLLRASDAGRAVFVSSGAA